MPSIASGDVTLETPFASYGLFSDGPFGKDFIGGGVSIPSLAFSTSPLKGGALSPPHLDKRQPNLNPWTRPKS